MKAELIFTGTELLLGQILNTNAAYLSRELAELGVDLYRIITVGDNRERIRDAIVAASASADMVLINGGLGPTGDDQTREALMEACQVGEVVHRETLEKIREYSRSRNLPMLKSNEKVAMVPEGAQVFVNPAGSAPGSVLEKGGTTYVLTPGPPHELKALFETHIRPWMKQRYSLEGVISSRVLKVAGIGESSAEDRVKHLITSTNPTLAPTVKRGEIHFRISAKADSREEADRMMAGMESAFREVLGDYVFGTGADTLEEVLGRLLLERGLRVSCAESCTGGLLTSTLTDVPGSSGYLEFSAVTYANRWKEEFLGVPGEVLLKVGAVSPETAKAMAAGIREKTGSDIGLAVSGIAGPDGGSLEKPVGLVYTALSMGDRTVSRKHIFSGGRKAIKEMAVRAALVMLYQALQGNLEQ